MGVTEPANPSGRMKGLTGSSRSGKTTGCWDEQKAGSSMVRKTSKTSQADYWQFDGGLEKLAKQAAFSALARLVVRMARVVEEPRTARDVDEWQDELAYCIEDLNNWKGVLQWLDDNSE